MANWLKLDKIEQWDYLFLLGFQYDSVTDAAIEAALLDFEQLAQVDPNLDWEDDVWLSRNTNIDDSNKHAYRVAALVHAMCTGHPIENAIELDTYNVSRCLSCIGNGHHRIRAIQYLNIPAAPFSLSGHVDPLEELVTLAGVDGPGGAFEQFFAPHLLEVDEWDIKP